MQQLKCLKLAPTHTHCGVLCLHTDTNSLSLEELLFLLSHSNKSLSLTHQVLKVKPESNYRSFG